MSRISEIILRARDTLADPDGARWSEARLLRLIDECQKDICLRAKVLRDKADVNVFAQTGEYTLPDEVMLLDRVLYGGVNLPYISHSELDRTLIGEGRYDWEKTTGIPKYLVFDKMNRRQVKLYPIPSDYILTSDQPSEFILEPYGITTGTDDVTPLNTYGVVSQVLDDENDVSFLSPYGMYFGQQESSVQMTVYYVKKPDDITSVDDELVVDSMFDKCIKFYVVGMALIDDMDTQNRTVGQEQLAYYDRDLTELTKQSVRDFVIKGDDQYTVTYRRF